MAKARRFEDLQCWQKGRQLANAVHELTGHSDFARDFRLRAQFEDASGSVMHNIAEGHDAGTDPEFIRFLRIARRSCSEVQSELYLGQDRKYITEAELKSTYFLADEAKCLINGLIAYLRKSGSAASSGALIRETAPTYVAADELSGTSLDYDVRSDDHQTNDKGLSD